MTKLEEFRARAESVGGAAWSEEIIIRGRPDGTISGRAYRIGWVAPGVTGAMVGGVEGPYDIPTEGESSEWLQVAADVNAAAINTVVVRDATIGDQATTIGQQASTIAQQASTLAQLQSQLDAANSRIQELEGG